MTPAQNQVQWQQNIQRQMQPLTVGAQGMAAMGQQQPMPQVDLQAMQMKTQQPQVNQFVGQSQAMPGQQVTDFSKIQQQNFQQMQANRMGMPLNGQG